MYVLAHNYIPGTDPLLDLIVSDKFIDQDDLAEASGVSVRTIETRVKKLKKDGMLEILRTKEREVFYLLGDDVNKKYTAHECREIYRYRGEPKMYVSPDDEEAEEKLVATSSMYHYPVTSTDSNRLGVDQLMEVRSAVEKLGY